MRRSDHTDDEIAFLLAEAEAGVPIDEICRTAHISLRTFYRWRKRFGGLNRSAVDRLHDLEDENRNLRRQLMGFMRASRSSPGTSGGHARSEFCDVTGGKATSSGLMLGRYSNVRLHQGR